MRKWNKVPFCQNSANKNYKFCSSSDTLAEWLRRRPAKPMGSPRAGSNPAGVAYHLHPNSPSNQINLVVNSPILSSIKHNLFTQICKSGPTGVWTQGLPHAKRMWYHYTIGPITIISLWKSKCWIALPILTWVLFCSPNVDTRSFEIRKNMLTILWHCAL